MRLEATLIKGRPQEGLFDDLARLRNIVNAENVKVFEFLGQIEDRIITLERRRG